VNIKQIIFFLGVVFLTSCQERLDNRKSNSTQNVRKTEKSTSKDSNRGERNTETSSSLGNSNPLGLAKLFKELEPSVFMVFAAKGDNKYSQGSGFFIGSDIGVTNSHVLEGASEYAIQLGDKIYPIVEILENSNSDNLDYVIFRIGSKLNRALRVAKYKPEIGDDIFAIGSPKGLTNSFTKGTVSGFRENDRIQIDATIDHGSSGGPLFNLNGEVIGITSSGLGTGAELNFAVDIQAIPFQKYN
jgi:serine protease Do